MCQGLFENFRVEETHLSWRNCGTPDLCCHMWSWLKLVTKVYHRKLQHKQKSSKQSSNQAIKLSSYQASKQVSKQAIKLSSCHAIKQASIQANKETSNQASSKTGKQLKGIQLEPCPVEAYSSTPKDWKIHITILKKCRKEKNVTLNAETIHLWTNKKLHCGKVLWKPSPDMDLVLSLTKISGHENVTMCWLFKKSFETYMEICRKRKFPVSGKLFWKTGNQLNCFVNIDNAIVYLHIFEKHNDKRFLTFTMCKQIESWSFKNFYGLTAKTFFYIWNIEIG